MRSFLPFSFLLALSCTDFSNTNSIQSTSSPIQQIQSAGKKYPINSWQYFLQHLPLVDSPIRDYKGKLIADQKKHIAIIPYDVGKADLQQCADALIRLRAEYLFQQKRYNDIGFHFVSGQYYTWNEYCNGLHVVAKGNNVTFIRSSTSEKTHESLRNYLDIVYAYSSTISLAKELKFANNFEVGTIVIHPGSPGHCFIIIDEAVNEKGEKLYKLAEGYTPAQSIYILRNLNEAAMTPWYVLKNGVIETASYRFTDYKLGKFE